MTMLKKAKDHLFLLLMIFVYGMLFVFWPSMAVASIKNSGYYIKEMLMIMPVIFVLTALLDLWLPKEKILRYLGEGAGLRGVVLSFVVGSISAGPIYAAFPMCRMLHKKGASIRNIVIILSSWAVIKLPMLLNEAKFLGLRFMVIRWVLTVIAILVFSWISAKLVKDQDLPRPPAQSGLYIHQGACMGCTLCVKSCPALFEMQGKKAKIKPYEPAKMDLDALQSAIDGCPVGAISYLEV